MPYTSKIDYKDLPQGARVLLEQYPHPIILKEHDIEKENESIRYQEEDNRVQLLKQKENEEKDRRMVKNEGYDPYNKGLNKVVEADESEEEDDAGENIKKNDKGKDKKGNKKQNDVNYHI